MPFTPLTKGEVRQIAKKEGVENKMSMTRLKEIFNLDILKPKTKITFTLLTNVTYYGKILECTEDVLTIKIKNRKPFQFTTDEIEEYKIELYESED